MARGSIQKRIGTTGVVSWTAIVDLTPDPVTGKRRQKRVTAATRREVELKVSNLLSDADKGFTDGGKTKLTQFLELWLQTQASALKPATVAGYRNLLYEAGGASAGRNPSGQDHPR